MERTVYATTSSFAGELLLVGSAGGLSRIHFQEAEGPFPMPSDWSEDRAVLAPAIAELEEYFAGARRAFDLPLAPAGTPFQRCVWAALVKIPYGRTISYAELGRQIGRPKASRAVGAANGQNPLPIVIPCHRVIGADGGLTGYAAGESIKRKLLELEGAIRPSAGRRIAGRPRPAAREAAC
jgi:methylated-DNA-[protein]-cysteine S-methyltransferase